MDIVWEEPPERAILAAQGGGRYIEFALVLREHPMKWAVLPGNEPRTEKGAKATAQNIRRGKTKGFDEGKYETAVDGTKIYVRYKGPADDGEPPQEPAEAPEDASDEPDTVEESTDEPQAAKVRAWAISQGFDVPRAGRLPRHITEKYHEANPPVRAV